MVVSLSAAVRNARINAIETAIGVGAKLMLFSGAKPANVAAATTGTLLAQWDLASDWANPAAGGTGEFSGVPLATAGLAAGTAGYFRLFANDGVTAHVQGTVTATGGGGDMTIDNPLIVVAQAVQITAFGITDGNA